MSGYEKGLCVQRLSTGGIFSVRAVDTAGITIDLAPDVYINRGIQPNINQLPDIDDYQPEPEPEPEPEPQIAWFILALANWVKSKEATEEALYRMQQFGFIFPNPSSGEMELTTVGEETLREHGLFPV